MHGYSGGRFARADPTILQHKVAPATLRRIAQFGRPYLWRLIGFLLLVVFESAVGVVNPLIYRRLINEGILTENTRLIVHLALLGAGVSIGAAIIAFVQRGVAVRIGQSMLFDLRLKLFLHIQRMPLAFFARARTGSIISRVSNDLMGVRDAFTEILSSAVGNLVTITLIIVAMLSLSWRLTVAILIIFPSFLMLSRIVGRRVQALTRQSFDRIADMNNLMVERFNVAGAQVAKVFGRPETERTIFEKYANQVRDIAMRLAVYMRFFFISLSLSASLSVAAIYGWGGVLTVHHMMDVGTIVALVSYLFRISGPLTALSGLNISVMTSIVSFERVFEVLDLKPMIVETKNPRAIASGAARIEFDQVVFRYPSPAEVSVASLEAVPTIGHERQKTVLHGISFVVEPGELVALVGPSGAGKTTITQLAARLYDPREGAVLINGVDLREATFDSLYRSVGMVMQEAHLFHDTIRANLAYAKPDATEKEIMAALEAAQILPLIESLPEGIDTVVGERGYRFSGGEKQRLAIARLLIKAPPIVILDEATAHLDSNSERAIQHALQFALAGRTSIVIAHRLSTIRSANQILVIDQGRIVERGRHDELLKADRLYAQLYQTQFA